MRATVLKFKKRYFSSRPFPTHPHLTFGEMYFSPLLRDILNPRNIIESEKNVTWHFKKHLSPLITFGDFVTYPPPSPRVSCIIWLAPNHMQAESYGLTLKEFFSQWFFVC